MGKLFTTSSGYSVACPLHCGYWGNSTYKYDATNQLLQETSIASVSFPPSSTTTVTTYDQWDDLGRPISGSGVTIVYDDTARNKRITRGNTVTAVSYDQYNNPILSELGTPTEYAKICSAGATTPATYTAPSAVLKQGSTVNASGGSYNFGRTAQSDVTFNIENQGTGDLKIDRIYLSGTNSSQFSLTQPGTSYVLAPGENLDFSVKFIPGSVPGYRSASFVIAGPNATNSFAISLLGSVALANPSAISTGYATSCALDGANIVCWGPLYTMPVLNAPSQVSVGWAHSCGLDSLGAQCWGDNTYGQIIVPALSSPTQISAGYRHTCALDSVGVKCWGLNTFGETTVPALTGPTQISAGNQHTCALDSSGVKCWGMNSNGESTVPALIAPTQVSTGGLHTCALDNTGVKCWGNNTYGQTTVPALVSPTQVSAGYLHTCALDSTGVKCWGYNSSGQTTVPALTAPIQVSAGGYHTCALDSTGVKCWGPSASPP